MDNIKELMMKHDDLTLRHGNKWMRYSSCFGWAIEMTFEDGHFWPPNHELCYPKENFEDALKELMR